jgi:hypothetical protein
MSFEGLPSVLKDGPFNGINIDVLDIQVQVIALCKMLEELELITHDDYERTFREQKYELLHNIRMAIEPTLKQKRTEQMLGINKAPILGSDGKPIK